MDWYTRGLDSQRAHSACDFSKRNIIAKVLGLGENPFNYTTYSYNKPIIITAQDMFEYYRSVNKEVTITITGGYNNGRVQQNTTKNTKRTNNKSTKTTDARNS